MNMLYILISVAFYYNNFHIVIVQLLASNMHIWNQGEKT